MLSKFEYDGKLNPRFCLGDFSLPVAKIEGISSDKAVPKIVHISSCGVTRLGNPELDLEKVLQISLTKVHGLMRLLLLFYR